MFFAGYLAMTAWELSVCRVLPRKIAWMACHFSPYGQGLSDLPSRLPPGSMLILNDRTPVRGHDPETVARQLRQAAEAANAERVLLDFQIPGNPQTDKIIKAVLSVLPCPAAVSECCGKSLNCPVFLSPPPPHIPLARYLEPWHGREVWLDISPGGEIITVTKAGSQITAGNLPEPQFCDSSLHCHYKTVLTQEAAEFHIFRTREDIAALQQEAQALGVACTVGLYQEWENIGFSEHKKSGG